jgi:hypothetical protein
MTGGFSAAMAEAFEVEFGTEFPAVISLFLRIFAGNFSGSRQAKTSGKPEVGICHCFRNT